MIKKIQAVQNHLRSIVAGSQKDVVITFSLYYYNVSQQGSNFINTGWLNFYSSLRTMFRKPKEHYITSVTE